MATERIETEIDVRPDKNGDKVVATSSASGDDDLQIEVEDDTPAEDRGRQPRAPGTPSLIPDEEEIGQYTQGVQDRLRQMKWEYHEERRAKEAWQREHNAAVDFAKRVHGENEKLRGLVSEGHKTLLDSTKLAAETEMASLEEGLRVALETGDTAKAAELQGKLARTAARAEAQNYIAPISFPQGDERREQVQQPQRQEVRLSESMQDWVANNPWFNQDKRMTAFAFGVHEELLEKKIPLESPKYFSEINKAVRESFPNYFGDEYEGNSRNGNGTNGRTQSPPRRNAVAGVTRSPAGRASNRVTLTASQVALAKRLGITEQQYAREMIRLENNDG